MLITERDKAILHALQEMKFLRTSQLAQLCFGRLNSTVRLRLRRLLDAGLIKTWVTALDEQNVYSLGRKGLAVLVGKSACEEISFNIPRRLERRLDHLTAINDFRINLALALPTQGGVIVKWLSEWQIKQPGKQGLVPDALFRLRVGQQTRTFSLEVDLGGEPAQKVFAPKLHTHVTFRGYNGLVPENLVVVTHTLRRLYTLLEVATREPGAADFLFTLRNNTSREQVLGKIWTSPRLAFATPGAVEFISLLDFFGGTAGGLHD